MAGVKLESVAKRYGSVSVIEGLDLDIRDLGLSAPRFLMFKVEDEVTVSVVIRGARVAGEVAP